MLVYSTYACGSNRIESELESHASSFDGHFGAAGSRGLLLAELGLVPPLGAALWRLDLLRLVEVDPRRGLHLEIHLGGLGHPQPVPVDRFLNLIHSLPVRSHLLLLLLLLANRPVLSDVVGEPVGGVRVVLGEDGPAPLLNDFTAEALIVRSLVGNFVEEHDDFPNPAALQLVQLVVHGPNLHQLQHAQQRGADLHVRERPVRQWRQPRLEHVEAALIQQGFVHVP
mmetsp:Transcript_5127/g.12387  ORF Transcript_5127/g.12387 Transcript_5127/m.12387 type:complete len:226 (-) Transcript_5127:495-1172(-)